jgi:hypothetical protein
MSQGTLHRWYEYVSKYFCHEILMVMFESVCNEIEEFGMEMIEAHTVLFSTGIRVTPHRSHLRTSLLHLFKFIPVLVVMLDSINSCVV